MSTPHNFPVISTDNPGYRIADLLDAVHAKLGLKNDAALSRALGVAPPVVSKIRSCAICLSSSMLIRLHDLTGWTINELRAYLIAPAT